MTLLQTKIQNGQETSDRMSFQCLKATGESKRLVLTYMHVISQFLQVLHTFYSMQIIVVDKYSTLRWAASYYWTEALRFGFIKYQQSKICVFFLFHFLFIFTSNPIYFLVNFFAEVFLSRKSYFSAERAIGCTQKLQKLQKPELSSLSKHNKI